jgi:hypothetical protein
MDLINSKELRVLPIRKRMTMKFSETTNTAQTREELHLISTSVVLTNNLNNRRKKSKRDRKNLVVQ